MGRGNVLIDGKPIIGPEVGDLEERSRSSDPSDWPVFSYSQGNVWNDCEQKWHYAYRLGFSSKETQRGLQVGTLVHDAADVYYGNGRSEEAVDAWFHDLTENSTDSDLPHLSKAIVTFKRYIKWSRGKDVGHQYLGNELHVVAPFTTKEGRNFKFQCYIDLLTQKDGEAVIWDHKTTSQGFWTLWEFIMEPQLILYAAMLREQGWNVGSRLLNMMNTYDYADGGKKKEQEDALFLRHQIPVKDKQMTGHVNQFKKLADEIISRADTPRMRLKKSCGKCGYKNVCATKLDGLPVGPILKSEFNKKESSA